MSYDVVVVGAGIGGLTISALLSARGFNVCLLERQAQVGGCVSDVQFGAEHFDPGMGIYADWGPGEIHDVIFSRLNSTRPKITPVANEVVARLSSENDIRLCRDPQKFSVELHTAFPECVDEAIKFYAAVRAFAAAEKTRLGEHDKVNLFKRVRTWLIQSEQLEPTVSGRLEHTSTRFRHFINAQLAAFAHTNIDQCSFTKGSLILGSLLDDHYEIGGGPSQLCELLAASFRGSGGKLRLNAPALRLAYDQGGKAIGVDLLTGETVLAKRAIVSNMTIWDTYGKLIGLSKTPHPIKPLLDASNTDGAYLLFATAQKDAIDQLPSPRMLIASEQEAANDDLPNGPDEMMFLAQGGLSKTELPVTVKSRVNVNDWFTYQSSPDDLEQWDQGALERLWAKLHFALPELGDGIEVIETSTPRLVYEQTRRKLGMVLGARSGELVAKEGFQTSVPNVFMVGDTVSQIPTLASVSKSALALADFLLN